MSIAASASELTGPTASACLPNSSERQLASRVSVSIPITRGSRWSRSSATIALPPLPIV
jgi:hypothetical protein